MRERVVAKYTYKTPNDPAAACLTKQTVPVGTTTDATPNLTFALDMNHG